MNFSKTSIERLSACHPDLIRVMNAAISHSPIDFGIACGHRTIQEQQKVFREGKSKLDGINRRSKHNYYPALAVDVYAYVNGKASWDKEHLAMVAGVVMSEASRLGISLRWGGTFGSNELKGWDKPHFELI